MTAVNGAPSGTLILRAARRGAGVGGERGGGRGSSWWEQRGSGSGAARRGDSSHSEGQFGVGGQRDLELDLCSAGGRLLRGRRVAHGAGRVA
jgi:hypothetical protein